MEHRDYNGWWNYETWVTKLWMDNEESSYHYWQSETQLSWDNTDSGDAWPGCTHKESAVADLAEKLKSQHEDGTPTVTGVYADLLNASLSEVNWHEIAENMINDAELHDEEQVAS